MGQFRIRGLISSAITLLLTAVVLSACHRDVYSSNLYVEVNCTTGREFVTVSLYKAEGHVFCLAEKVSAPGWTVFRYLQPGDYYLQVSTDASSRATRYNFCLGESVTEDQAVMISNNEAKISFPHREEKPVVIEIKPLQGSPDQSASKD